MAISLKQYYEILARYLRPQRLRFALLTVLVLASIGLQIVNPQIMRFFIDAATKGKPLNVLTLAALAFIGLALLQQVLAVGAAYAGEYVGWVATNTLREDLATHCLMLDMHFHHEKSPGELIERIESDALEFSVFFSQLVLRVAGNILLMLGIMIALFLVDWRLGTAFAIFALATLAGLNAVRNVSIPYQKAARDANTDLAGFLEERLAGTEDIRSCGAVDYVLRQLFALQTVIYRCWRKSALMNIYVRVTAGMLLMCGYGVAFVFGSQLYHAGVISIGIAYLVVHYTGLIARPIRELSLQVEGLQNIGATVERMSEVLRQESSIVDGPGVVVPSETPLPLAFEHVTFAYHEEKTILHNVSFRIEPGKVLGLLGRTGSGKTTIARLVFRLYDPQQGAILLQGTDIRQAKLDTLRHRVAFVTQDVQLFQASVRDNITFFNRSISDARIMEVIEAMELGEWFADLPDGLDTRLQTGGRSLSAGEAQLLAFTRVFLRNPGLVVLDEASSRLDPATERLIEKAIDHLLENRSAIIIAHRLGTLHRADDVLILEEGRVAEYGNRLQLLGNTSSRFYHLHQTGLEEVLI
ncbi:MAG TPA: ABC transporter ATP-binding protein [Armatimonadota bacterium]|jgi:ABC-type multidrug transport system fused ATPase/permease subunit